MIEQRNKEGESAGHQKQLQYKVKIARFRNLENVDPFTPRMLTVILLTVCHTVRTMLVRRIWFWID